MTETGSAIGPRGLWGRYLNAIDAIGGAANAGLLLDIFADTWGVPVSGRDLIDEAGSVGAAVVAGVGVGVFDDFDATLGFSTRASSRTPDMARHAASRAEYAEFLDAYARLEPWFDATADARRG